MTVDIAMAVRESQTVRKATAAEIPQLAAVLARAFEHDPPTAWTIPDDARRRQLLARGFELYLRKLWFKQDESYVTDGIAGAAVWELPGEWKASPWQQLRLVPRMLAIYGRLFPRVAATIAALERNHPETPHYYLPFIGVDPEWQGRGLGAALMQPIIERCDRTGVAAYLEASTPRNRALYARFGFEVTEEFTLGKGSPPVWRMWREPSG